MTWKLRYEGFASLGGDIRGARASFGVFSKARGGLLGRFWAASCAESCPTDDSSFETSILEYQPAPSTHVMHAKGTSTSDSQSISAFCNVSEGTREAVE